MDQSIDQQTYMENLLGGQNKYVPPPLSCDLTVGQDHSPYTCCMMVSQSVSHSVTANLTFFLRIM